MSSVVLAAPAKVNLGLWVGSRRPDGYHEIVTIVVPLEFGDKVSMTRAAKGITVTTDSPAVPNGPANLAYQAAERFLAAAHVSAGCRIRIKKRIPVGSGLGGGSSDAATVLRGMNRLFGRPLTPAQLMAIARKVGSDVPALLFGRACVARGRGERLRRIGLPRLNVILCPTGYAVQTAWAYAELDRWRASMVSRGRAEAASRVGGQVLPDLTGPGNWPKILAARLRRGELEQAARLMRNSFESVVFRHHPDLAKVKRLLYENGCFAAGLSGSGSTVYGLMEKAVQDPMAALKRQGLSCIRTSSIQAKHELKSDR
ncbi:MAG: 4-(cytidine 5'-diphospho)-2-C-methyl-D-erythritol kinase [candidate division WOR-3 bacterium]